MAQQIEHFQNYIFLLNYQFIVIDVRYSRLSELIFLNWHLVLNIYNALIFSICNVYGVTHLVRTQNFPKN